MPTKATPTTDRRALKILFDTYWTSVGWRDEKARSTPPADFEYAKRAGVMFDEARLSHDDLVKRALASVHATDRQSVANAFVVSLASRRLDLRSALGSFAVLQHFPRHKATAGQGACAVCGEYDCTSAPEDLNVLNFERFKWGGVRHDQPLYAALDLELFERVVALPPGADDVQLLKALFDAIEKAPPRTSSASLQKHLSKVLQSNKPERDAVVAILGLCDILSTKDHPGYMRRFVAWSGRELPDRHFVDMAYPACWWTRADGISQEAIEYWFGHLF
jgi:hypothetical protein